ncbi:MAG: hypothetical protein WC147_02560 [Syntrophomonas sp.]|jgi:hypothetical protein
MRVYDKEFKEEAIELPCEIGPMKGCDLMIMMVIYAMEGDDDKAFMLNLYNDYYGLVRKTVYNMTICLSLCWGVTPCVPELRIE